ncbi:UNVERIFIED_CONTAM: hypothetical protein Sradi_4561400 [Sesamum radiatum]|uniref:Reverse transcriptase zinc-binding domain-containing protein n=1 Tax=Sesamum radiatum TaxID=300843 RepID=A0AAW2NDH4_SESRA
MPLTGGVGVVYSCLAGPVASPTYLFQAYYSAPPPSSVNLRVLVFIDSSLRDWDRAKIDEMFWPKDKDVILGMPLSQLGVEDIIVWHYFSFGLFSMQSAYHLTCSLPDHSGPSDLFVSEQMWWHFLWQAKIPCKIKVFIWKVCRNVSRLVLILLNDCRGSHVFARIAKRRMRIPCMFSWTATLPGRRGFRDGYWGCGKGSQWCLPGLVVTKVLRKGNGETTGALATREVIQLAARRGRKPIIIERDCAVLIGKLRTVD